MVVDGVDHVVFVVSDLERSVGWYRDLLGLEVERLDQWRAKEVIFVSLRISDTTIIDLFEGEPEAGTVGHVALVVRDVDLEELCGRPGVDVEMGPTTLWGAQGNGTGIYVRDPDRNRIELRTYG
jgi:catechol 2,3-dioxygenase-like lactoylglutathione lyase family enzyme